MPGRTYGEACPIATAMDMIGERWALLVIRELRLGPRRFGDLEDSLVGVGPSVLAQRLRELEGDGVVRRRTLPGPGGARVYELTEWGAELEPVFTALARWGVRSPVVSLRGDLTDDTAMLAFRTFFDRGTAAPWTATYEFRLARERYVLQVVRGRLTSLQRAAASGPVDATVETTGQVLSAVRVGAERLDDAMGRGAVTITGDVAAVRRLLAAWSGPRLR